MNTPFEIGNALEAAVRAIEEVILKNSPTLREDTFVIESKKIVAIDGVHHEIDLFVTVDHGHGYKALFIFECKNWSTSPVGKNEIIVFSEKISIVQAQHGFFVAKAYTADASAQAQKNPRMTLLTATEHDSADTPVPLHFHFVGPVSAEAQVVFLEPGSTGERHLPMDPASARLSIGGEEANLDRYVRDWISQVCDESTNGFPSGTLPEGVYDRPVSAIRTFSKSDFVLNGRDVETAKLKVVVKLRVLRPPIISHFEVATRGRVLLLAPVTIEGVTLSVSFVEK